MLPGAGGGACSGTCRALEVSAARRSSTHPKQDPNQCPPSSTTAFSARRVSCNGFSGNLSSAGAKRATSRASPMLSAIRDAAIYLFADDRALVRVDGERAAGAVSRWPRPMRSASSRDSLILLGIAPEGPRFAATVPVDVALPDEHQGDRSPLAGDPGRARSARPGGAGAGALLSPLARGQPLLRALRR